MVNSTPEPFFLPPAALATHNNTAANTPPNEANRVNNLGVGTLSSVPPAKTAAFPKREDSTGTIPTSLSNTPRGPGVPHTASQSQGSAPLFAAATNR